MRVFRAVFAAILVCLVNPALAASDPAAGFQRLTTPDGVEVGIWYPSQGEERDIPLGLNRQQVVPGGPVAGERLPLVVMSHGTGGSFAGHADTAVALAKAGFVVAALTHPGDNWKDQSKATEIANRPAAFSGLIDFMLGSWSGHAAIDASRIGAFGFSSGGFTVLTAAGGIPDLSLIRAHCAAHPGRFDCRLIAKHPSDAPAKTPKPWPARRDARIKALVVAAPALGFTFADGGLDAVRVPVQLWRADDDTVLPPAEYADAVRDALPSAPEFHTVPHAGHFDFLAPCDGPVSIPALCTSAPGFDRAAFHHGFDAAVTAFFTRMLASAQTATSAGQ
ncbi:alpha/beta hydrolase family protein [Novosphingobium mangrovi (ex Huang et al. 2023)]|uniref:Dienelactone hydrolase n=1 Tax=Novosphingobium mangrovi (ex Huang et al. 2023) TaxID=2976432 RepID=A0ABT2I0B2_9SPHN|nr:dienelactone hydrolase [Novosphingobium mangrovi (ex Huang et al. 2023)]MCT2398240.1 dienelactone hydrolase [Novosphingobium mangrovi (ex Huang et al. 2023)]